MFEKRSKCCDALFRIIRLIFRRFPCHIVAFVPATKKKLLKLQPRRNFLEVSAPDRTGGNSLFSYSNQVHRIASTVPSMQMSP